MIVNTDAKSLEFENRFVHNSKVNPDIVRHIRKKEMQQRAYAKLYGLCQRTVAEIQKKLTWKHVADQPEIGSEGRDQ